MFGSALMCCIVRPRRGLDRLVLRGYELQAFQYKSDMPFTDRHRYSSSYGSRQSETQGCLSCYPLQRAATIRIDH
jgi:hypothetical protein